VTPEAVAAQIIRLRDRVLQIEDNKSARLIDDVQGTSAVTPIDGLAIV